MRYSTMHAEQDVGSALALGMFLRVFKRYRPLIRVVERLAAVVLVMIGAGPGILAALLLRAGFSEWRYGRCRPPSP